MPGLNVINASPGVRIPKASLLHSFQLDGRRVLLNGESLALVLVTPHLPTLLQEHGGELLEVLYDTLAESGNAEDARALEQLAQGGFFEAFSGHDLRLEDERQAAEIEGRGRLNNAHVEVASNCNLACTYCYADGGSFQNTQPLGFMSVETASRFIEFYLDRIDDFEFLDILGGEPLMNPHLQEIIDLFLTEAAKRNKDLRLQLTTNGTLLTARWAEFLASRKIRVAVSIDGNAAVHNSARPTRGGRGSYAAALAGLKRLAALDPTIVSIRVTVGPHNVQHILGFYDKMCEEVGNIRMDLSPVITTPAHPMALRPEDLEVYLDTVAELSRRMYEKQAAEREGVADQFKESELFQRKPMLIHCSPGINLLAVNIKGDLYPCVPFIQRNEARIGNLDVGLTPGAEPVQKMLTHRGVVHRPKCLDCWAKYLCAGGCLGMNALYGGDAHQPSEHICSIYRAMVEGQLIGYANAWIC